MRLKREPHARPFMRTEPPSLPVVLRPASTSSRVDLPAPEGPSRATVSPGMAMPAQGCRTWSGREGWVGRRGDERRVAVATKNAPLCAPKAAASTPQNTTTQTHLLLFQRLRVQHVARDPVPRQVGGAGDGQAERGAGRGAARAGGRGPAGGADAAILWRGCVGGGREVVCVCVFWGWRHRGVRAVAARPQGRPRLPLSPPPIARPTTPVPPPSPRHKSSACSLSSRRVARPRQGPRARRSRPKHTQRKRRPPAVGGEAAARGHD